jgi:nucleoside-diphosphate-sugar epimerase
MMDIIGRLLNKRGIGIIIPVWVMSVIAWISETVSKLAGKAPLFSRDKVRELTADWKLDVSKARKHLDFETMVDFPKGAETAIEWYRQEGWLK